MTNSDIVERLEDAMALMELLEHNHFKINAFRTVVQQIEKLPEQLQTQSLEQRSDLFSKTMAANVDALIKTGTFPELEEMENQVPMGVRNLFLINGIGPKKIKTLWKDAGIESVEALQTACVSGQIAQIKGFGEKLQQTILDGISFLQSIQGKLLMHKGEQLSAAIESRLTEVGIAGYQVVGDIAIKSEVVSGLSFLFPKEDYSVLKQWISDQPDFVLQVEKSSPWVLKSIFQPTETLVMFHFAGKEDWWKTTYQLNTTEAHWEAARLAGIPLYNTWMKGEFQSEEALFEKLGQSPLPKDVRIGSWEWSEKKDQILENLIRYEDVKGCIHNHSRYSDGKNTILEMAEWCIAKGWTYFGIADHSKSAHYAQGLWEEKVLLQWQEIDRLNEQWQNFKILKGIESDILPDGSLDYEEDILRGFDYIVASVHSGLKMDKETATQRLIKAIENPYTRILGHCSGRILLRREGYPLHYQKVIEACVQNKVAIEINAHPSRLDMDWRYLAEALEKGAFLSINPDAHEREGMDMTQYGVWMARKAGAAPAQVINTFTTEKIESFFKK